MAVCGVEQGGEEELGKGDSAQKPKAGRRSRLPRVIIVAG